MFKLFAVLAAIMVQPADQAEACANQIERAAFTVCYADPVPDAAAEWIAGRVESDLALVQAYLADIKTYEGPPYETPLVIYIDPDRFGPFQRRSRIYLPQSRVLAGFEGRTDERTDLGLVHELTHVLAASAYRRDRDRFYDDGLAVFLQHRFGGEDNYPNFGEDLYVATARAMLEHGAFIPLEQAEQVRNARESAISRKLAYLQEGAFTQYLIERFGLSDYFRIYHGAPIEEVTGTPLGELEAGWRLLIEAAAPAMAEE